MLQPLPATTAPGKATVLACGAWLKNSACLLQDDTVFWSALHGDLGDPANCVALERSVASLVARADGAIAAVAHDLHPDFFSTRLAQRVAAELQVPAIAVQHHHAHIGALMAEHGLREPVIGIALDGVGLGTDQVAWGGELLSLDGPVWHRLGHLMALPLPGGDIAAREPWRMAAAALHVLGRGDEIVARYADAVGDMAAKTVQAMLVRGFNCPSTTGAGRWFDAAAGVLGVSVKQAFEAEAAIALERLADGYLAQLEETIVDVRDYYLLRADGVLDLRPLLTALLTLADNGGPLAIARGAALFHVTMAEALSEWAAQAAQEQGAATVALGGGCFLNAILRERLVAGLTQRGLRVVTPDAVACGDSGLALGQAWVAREQLWSQRA